MASWYGSSFNGHRTASGERYDMHALTAAHPSLPFGTMVLVTNLDNGRQVIVRINDRGPYKRRRVIDVSYAAARALGMIGPGSAEVELALVRRGEPTPAPYVIASTAPAAPANGGDVAAAPASGSGIGSAPSSGDSAAPVAAAAAGYAPRASATASPAVAAATEGEAAADGAESAAAAAPDGGWRRAGANVGGDPQRTDAGANVGGDVWRAGTGTSAGGGGALHYTVQVGAFGELERANALEQSLSSRYPAVTVVSDGTWNRVQIGTFSERDEAETFRREVAAAGLSAIVIASR